MPEPRSPFTRPPVRVFISSTFRDMHAERDHLVTVVFPELRERLERLGLEFFDVDLRWGVPETGVDGETANSWEYCKKWIDGVEPFFVTILGQRYGWVPPPTEITEETDRSRWENLSITEMEIRHAVLERQGLYRRSYFYLRETEVPPSPGTTPETYAEFVDADHEADVTRLKALIRATTRPVRPYACDWLGDHFENLDAFGRLVLEDLWSGVLRDTRYVAKDTWREVLGHDPVDDPIYSDEWTPVPEVLWQEIVEHVRPATLDPLAQEAEEMAAFGAGRLRWFQGRTEEIETLKRFATANPSDEHGRLLVVKAVPGEGKSALLARFAREVEAAGARVILHFVGATEGSADIRSLLLRLIRELNKGRVEDDVVGPEAALEAMELTELQRVAAERLRDYSDPRRVVLILDGLNQLSGGHELQWLPSDLSPSVWIVASCAGEQPSAPGSPGARVLAALQARRPEPEWLLLGGLSGTDVRAIITTYLEEYCKQLDSVSIDRICAMAQAKNPLYLVVMLGELRTLGGNDMNLVVPRLISDMEVKYPDTMSLFGWVLERLEVFGRRAVGLWCGYLSLGRVGMSSRELRELLERQLGGRGADAALRIERGLRRYLLRRGLQLDFFHGQLREAVARRYVDTREAVRRTHAELAAHFRTQARDEAGAHTQWRIDRPRCLSELPYHLTEAASWDRVVETLCDIAFVGARSRAGVAATLGTDYAHAEASWPHDSTPPEDDRAPRPAGLSARQPSRVSMTEPREASDALPGHWAPIERLRAWRRFVGNHTGALIAADEMAIHMAYNQEAGGPVAGTVEQRLAKNDLEAGPWLKVLGRRRYMRNPARVLAMKLGRRELCCAAITPDGRVAACGEGTQEGHSISTKRFQVHATSSVRWVDLVSGDVRSFVTQAESIDGVALSADGRWLLASERSDHPTFRLWDVNSGCSRVLELPDAELRFLAFPEDGLRTTATRHRLEIDPGGGVRFWERHNDEWRLLGTYDGAQVDEGQEVCSAITADEAHVVLGSFDGLLHIWEPATNARRTLVAPGWITALALTPDGATALSAHQDGSIQVWNLATGQSSSADEVHPAPVNALSRTSNGATLVSANVRDDLLAVTAQFAGRGSELRAWDAATGALRWREPDLDSGTIAIRPETGDLVLIGHRTEIRSAANGRLLHEIELPERSVLGGIVSPAGDTIYVRCFDLNVLMVESQRGICLREFESILLGPEGGWVLGLAVSRDGRLLAMSHDDSVLLVDVSTGETVRWLKGAELPHWQLAFSADGRSLVSIATLQSLHCWDVQSGQQRFALTAPDGFHKLDLAPDGRVGIGWGPEATAIHVFDLHRGLIGVYEGHTDAIAAATVSPDAGAVVSASGDGTVRVWDLKTLNTIAVHHAGVGISALSGVGPDGGLAYGTNEGRVVSGRLVGVPLAPPLVTATSLWRLDSEDTRAGHRETEPTVLCPWCCRRLAAPADVLAAIRRHEDGARRERAAHAAAPDPAGWSDQTLLSSCPHCHGRLRFNPFVARAVV